MIITMLKGLFCVQIENLGRGEAHNEEERLERHIGSLFEKDLDGQASKFKLLFLSNDLILNAF